MTVRELDKLVRNDGWYLVKQVGSHMQYKHPTKTGKVTIPNHRGDVDIRTANSILKQEYRYRKKVDVNEISISCNFYPLY